jgi:hypothetical protein
MPHTCTSRSCHEKTHPKLGSQEIRTMKKSTLQRECFYTTTRRIISSNPKRLGSEPIASSVIPQPVHVSQQFYQHTRQRSIFKYKYTAHHSTATQHYYTLYSTLLYSTATQLHCTKLPILLIQHITPQSHHIPPTLHTTPHHTTPLHCTAPSCHHSPTPSLPTPSPALCRTPENASTTRCSSRSRLFFLFPFPAGPYLHCLNSPATDPDPAPPLVLLFKNSFIATNVCMYLSE